MRKGPFSYENMKDNFRIRDADDNRIATCWDEDNAKFIVQALNDADRTRLERESKA